MVIPIAGGKLIATLHEVMIKFENNHLTLQAKNDDLVLWGDTRILVANAGSIRWSFSLDSQQTVDALILATGISVS